MLHPLHSFIFCPRCGARAFEPHDIRSNRCAACGFTYYHNASAAVVAVIRNPQGDWLVARRKYDPAAGTLDLIGGFVDPGESVEDALLREIREETGCEARLCRYLFSLPNRYEYSAFQVDTTDLFWACELLPGQIPRAADDAAELMWLPTSQLCPEDFGLSSICCGMKRLLSQTQENKG